MTARTRILIGGLIAAFFLGGLIAATVAAISIHDTTPGGYFQTYGA